MIFLLEMLNVVIQKMIYHSNMILILTENIPSKKNSRISTRSGKNFPSKDYTRWHKMASLELKIQNRPLKPLEIIKEIIIHIFFPTKRKADITNKVESVMDLLVDNGILLDDNYMVCPNLNLSGSYRKNQAGAHIEIIF